MTEATFRFSLDLANKIWQVVLCQRTGNMILEERDEANQSIHYHLVNLDGSVEEGRFDIQKSDLWTNSLIYRHPYFLLEQYVDPNDPSAKSILIYHVVNRSLEAEIPQFQYDSITGKELVGVDPKDTSVRKTYLLEELDSSENLILRSPVYYKAGSESCELVEQFLETEPSGLGCEYYEEEDFIIICHYVRLGTKFDRWITVIKEGEIYYASKIDEQLEGFASGGFFILNNVLVFIENSKKINGIEL